MMVELNKLDDGGGETVNEDTRTHLLDLTEAELREWLEPIAPQKYRAGQILQWIYEKQVDDFDQMTNLSKDLRGKLASAGVIYRGRVTRRLDSQDGTRKLLLTWPDGNSVESVLIPDGRRQTACISSQVGCPVGCAFCASGLEGVKRNLTAGEIVEQALRVSRLVAESPPDAETGEQPERLSNIVFMGMGEPLANYKNVVKALRVINAESGLNIGARKITVSTVGLPKQIRQLADEGLQINLALSLHAPHDRLRQELIPWGKVPIDELISACRYFFEKTGREVTLEYVLLGEVNDRSEHAQSLARIAKTLRCNVNLLRYNSVPGLPFARPGAETAYEFQQMLRQRGVNAHVRTSRGRDIEAACGQLRRSSLAGRPGGAQR